VLFVTLFLFSIFEDYAQKVDQSNDFYISEYWRVLNINTKYLQNPSNLAEM